MKYWLFFWNLQLIATLLVVKVVPFSLVQLPPTARTSKPVWPQMRRRVLSQLKSTYRTLLRLESKVIEEKVFVADMVMIVIYRSLLFPAAMYRWSLENLTVVTIYPTDTLKMG